MKRNILFVVVLLVTISVFSQNDSIIESQTYNYRESKSSIIEKGRNLLLDKLLSNDLKGLKEIRKYLMEKIADDNYIVLSLGANWTIL